MKTPTARHVLEATASLLSEDPDLSNAELLRRLTIQLGQKEMRAILVTRFQRQVREPALRLLQDRVTGGRAENGKEGDRSTPEPEPPRDDPSASPSSHRNGRPRRAKESAAEPERLRAMTAERLRAVDEALERAFRLGAEAEAPSEIVAAFRQLDTLRRDLRELLGKTG